MKKDKETIKLEDVFCHADDEGVLHWRIHENGETVEIARGDANILYMYMKVNGLDTENSEHLIAAQTIYTRQTLEFCGYNVIGETIYYNK